MATASRDAKLTLSVESLGQENISKLEKALRDLADTGDSSAAEFAELADQIGRLGNQNDALQAVKALAASTDELSAKQERAGTVVQEVTARLDALKVATDEAKVAQQNSRQAWIDGDKAYVEARTSLANLKAAFKAGEVSTDSFNESNKRLTREIGEARVKLVELRAARDADTLASTKAEAAQSKVETTLRNATKQYDSASVAVEKQATALKEASQRAEELGVDTETLAAAETKLIAKFNETVTAVTSHKTALKAAADAEAELSAQAALAGQKLAERNKFAEAAYKADMEMAAAAKATADALAQQALAVAKVEQAIRDKARADEAAAEAAKEQRESDRLFAIQYNTKIEALKKGKEALEAENAAQRDAAALTARLAKEQQDAADKISAGAKKIDDAFKSINIRSLEQVEQELKDVKAAMETVASSGKLTGGALAVAMDQGKVKVQELEREMRQLNGAMTLADQGAGILKNSMGQIAAGNLVADGIGYLINKIKEMGAAFVGVIADQESLRRGLNAVYKDAGLTASQMEFLRGTAMSSGVALGELGPAFLKFAAATNSANIPLKVTNELFAATTRAAGTLGLSGEQVSGMLEALGQMASKGTVSLEELRQQLGDRLPGALSLVAKGLGLTEARLIALVESGGLAARDLFPALTKSLMTMHGEVTGLTATWENLKTMMTTVAQDMGDAGWTVVLTGALKTLAATVSTVGLGLSTVTEGMRLVGVAAGALAAYLGGNKQAWTLFNEEVAVSVDRLTKQTDRMTAMLNPTSEAAKRVAALGTAQMNAAKATVEATGAIAKQAPVVATVKESTEALVEANALLMNSTKELGSRIVELNDKSDKRVKKLKEEAESEDKLVKAVQISGAALVTLTQLRGSDIETLQAQETATLNNLAAQQKATDKHTAMTQVLEIQRETLVKLIGADKEMLELRKGEIEALDVKITKSRAETEQSTAARFALEQEVTARKLATQSHKDNSAALDEFRKAAVNAEAAVKAFSASMDTSAESSTKLIALQTNAAVAVGLYRDALKDAAEKAAALNLVEQAKINLQTTGLSVQQQAYTALANAARATGDLTLATQYEIEAKRIQIEITNLTAKAKIAEANATIAAANAEKEALLSSGDLTEAKKLEIEARILNAQAKIKEAEAAGIVVKGLEAEIDAIQRGTSARGDANRSISANTSAMAANTSEREKSIAAREKEIELDAREKALADKMREGSATMTNELGTRTGIVNFLKSMGVDDEERARQIANEFADSNGDIVYSNNPGQLKYGGAFSTLSEAVAKAAEQYTFGSGKTGKSTMSLGGGAPAPTPSAATGRNTKTVTINIGRSTNSVTTASEADANSLVSALRELETQAGTST